MSDRRKEFRVGVVALATAAITALLMSITAGPSFRIGAAPYTIQIRVDRAPGVGPNTPVRKDGVPIGRVVDTEFLPTGGVLVTANVQPNAPIYEGDVCRIRPSSLFGDAVINFAYSGEGEPQRLESGATVEGMALPDPIESLTTLQIDLGPAIASIGEAAEGVTRLSDRVNQVLGADFQGNKLNSLLEQAETSSGQFTRTMEDMSRTVNRIDQILSDPRIESSIDALATETPQLLIDARATVGRANETLASFGGVVSSAQANLENLEGLTRPLGDRGEELSRMLTSAIENLDKTLADAARFTGVLGDSQGTISRLVRDPAFYENLNTVMGNANTVILRLDQVLRQLRPVIDDARVFTDKIAREPGRLIGGAVNRGPGVK